MLLLCGISFLPHVYLIFTGPEIEASTKGPSGENANQSGHLAPLVVGRDWSKYLIRGPCIEISLFSLSFVVPVLCVLFPFFGNKSKILT